LERASSSFQAPTSDSAVSPPSGWAGSAGTAGAVACAARDAVGAIAPTRRTQPSRSFFQDSRTADQRVWP
jgi:hypothetical protein